MTRVCLLGDADVNLRYELLSRETARDALLTYDLREHFENAVGLETVSLGAAVALLNDLDWYLIRFVDDAIVREPSVSETEWLSRDLASAIRDDDVDPDDSGRFLKVYGVDRPSDGDDANHGDRDTNDHDDEDDDGDPDKPTEGSDDTDNQNGGGADDGPVQERSPRLVEPMLVARTGTTIPEYDLRDVEETLVVRLTESEFDA